MRLLVMAITQLRALYTVRAYTRIEMLGVRRVEPDIISRIGARFGETFVPSDRPAGRWERPSAATNAGVRVS